MNKIISCAITLLLAIGTFAQHQITITVKDTAQQGLPGATVIIQPSKRSGITDSAGVLTINNIAAGKYRANISYAGFEEQKLEFTIPLENSILQVILTPEEEEEEEVIVKSTRTSRNIKNVPTRVETISLEEIDEKANMRPSNVSMILHESTGIQVQQTSATSANASIRIQGLDGRYTQLLKDGLSGYGNFASGLSVLEIPPLDLQQVEIIKGPASTLYGGGAIAGVINFIPRIPGSKAVNDLLINQSSIGQTNAGYFSSGRNKRWGYTFLGLVNNQQRYDVDKDDFTEVPKSIDFTINPKLFYYPDEKTTIILSNSLTMGKREGGDVQVILGKADSYHRYFETNKTMRNMTSFELDKQLKEGKRLTLKQGFTIFDRSINIPDYLFDGVSYNSFTDLNWLTQINKHALVVGGNIVYDNFNESEKSAANRDNKNLTAGAYIQDTWDISDRFKLESGIRVDWAKYSNSIYENDEFFVLPRISLLVNYNSKLSSRIGAGLGYKLPTLFTEETETMQYKDVLQLDSVKAERSYGGTADINYKTKLGHDFEFSLNTMFFYSWIDKPLVLEGYGVNNFKFYNQDKPVQSMGFESNLKFIYRHNFKLFLGYTFTDARAEYLQANQFLTLVPKHKFNSALIYEKHESIKLGLEGYFTGAQHLTNGMITDDFWEFGFMAEKIFEKFSIYINFENFTDARQSRYKRVVNDPHPNPTFDEIWNHTEGFVINGGVKLRL